MTDIEQLTNERLEANVAYLAQEIERCMARWLDLIAEFDRRKAALAAGFRGTAEWLSWLCHLELRTARAHVRVARRLQEWPEMRAAYASGELSYSKLRALSRADADEDPGPLIELARSSTAERLEYAVRSLRSARSADLDVINALHERRYLNYAWEPDGCLRVHARLTPDEGAALIEALETGAEALHLVRDPNDGEVTPRPPLAARRADALTEMVLSGAPRTQVVLHVDEPALACSAAGGEPRAGDVCALEAGPAVPSETARRLSCDADLVVGHGRKRRVVSPALRNSLERRDRGCRFPGCIRRHGVHAHHIEHWVHGGTTDPENLVLLCRFHHRLVHEGGFGVMLENGDLAFRRPDGRTLPSVPAPVSVDRAPPGMAVAA